MLNRLSPEILLFGGTFDPPHYGHIKVIEEARQLYPKSEIWVVPSYSPPPSNNVSKSPAASWDLRLEMCRLAFGHIDNLLISSVEKSMPSPNYTFQTLEHISLETGKKLSFLMGMDQFMNFPRWNSFEKILKVADILIHHRGGLSMGAFKERDCDEDLDAAELDKVVSMVFGDEFHLVDTDLFKNDLGQYLHFLRKSVSPASSRLWRDDNEKYDCWISDKVRNFISENKLYPRKDEN